MYTIGEFSNLAHVSARSVGSIRLCSTRMEDLPEQYKGEKREHDFIIRGERTGEVTDTESKKALLADKPLTVKSLVRCAFGGLPHCEVTTE